MANSNATSVGAVSFDLGLNTNGLTQAINEAARNASTQLSEAFRTALTGCENSINSIGNSLTQMTSGFQNNVNQMSQNMTDTFRNASTQIASDMQNNMAQMSQNMTDTFRNTSAQIAGDVQNSMSQMSQNMTDSIRDSSSQLTQGLSANAGSLSQHLGNAAGQVEELGNEARNTAKSIGSTLGSAVKKLGTLIISVFAVKQVVSFSKACVEAAAEVKALNAQLEQTFGTLENEARNAIQKVANESGILETRLQSTGTQIYAFAKASGMDSVNALNMMQEALQVTADSAAYYDRSIEDTAESLRSFLKGNYANDAALGISCTETTRNAAANKLYGKSFMELSEAQKQLTLLQMVKDANALSGAMGQAAREADGWENVTGNLKEAWKQFKAVIGKPLLQSLIPIVKGITSAIQTLTSAASEATKVLADLFGWDLSEAENTGGAISDIAADTAEDVSEAEEEAQEDIEDTVKAQKKAQGQLAGFDNLNVLSMPDEDNDSDNSKDDNKEVEKNDDIDDIAESAELAKSSVDDLNQSVSSVKFDVIKKQLQELMKSFEPLTSAVKRNVQAAVDNAQKGIEKYLDKYGDKISEYSDRIKGHLENTATQTANGITNLLNEAAASQERCSDELSTGYADLMGGASIFALSFADVFSGGLDIVSKNFEDWTVDNSDTIGEFFDGLNGNAANAMSTFGGILEDIGTTLTTWWDEKGSQAFDGFIGTLFDIGDFLMELWNDYVTPFIDYLIDSVGDFWDNHLSKLWNNILEFVSSLMDCISALWNNWFRPLWDKLLRGPITGIMGALKSIWDAVLDVFGVIVDVVRGIIRSLQGVLDFITGIFTGDIEKCVKGLAEFIHGICIIIWGVIKGAINLVIDALNAVWSAFYGMLKEIVDGIGAFVGKIGDLLGKDWGFTLPDEVPRIPRLAQGGLVKAPTIAMVGDNKNAYNDPEVISPLSKLQGMLDSENSDDTEILQQILMYLKMLCDFNKNGGGNIEITAKCDEDVLFKSTVKKNGAYKRRHGGKSAYA